MRFKKLFPYFLALITSSCLIYLLSGGGAVEYRAWVEVPKGALEEYNMQNGLQVLNSIIYDPDFAVAGNTYFPNVELEQDLSFGVVEEFGTSGQKIIMYVEYTNPALEASCGNIIKLIAGVLNQVQEHNSSIQ